MLFELKRIREESGLKQKQVAEALNISLGTYRNWEQLRSIPQGGSLSKLASFFGVSPEALFGDDVITHGTLNLPAYDDNDFEMVPLCGHIAAGKPIEFDSIDRHIPIRRSLRKKYPKSYLMIVDGRSVDRVIPDGAYALVDPTQREPVIDSKLYAVCVNGYSATIKRVKKLANGIELIPDSTDPTIKSMIFDYSDENVPEITIMGRVVWYTLPDDFEL